MWQPFDVNSKTRKWCCVHWNQSLNFERVYMAADGRQINLLMRTQWISLPFFSIQKKKRRQNKKKNTLLQIFRMDLKQNTTRTRRLQRKWIGFCSHFFFLYSLSTNSNLPFENDEILSKLVFLYALLKCLFQRQRKEWTMFKRSFWLLQFSTKNCMFFFIFLLEWPLNEHFNLITRWFQQNEWMRDRE